MKLNNMYDFSSFKKHLNESKVNFNEFEKLYEAGKDGIADISNSTGFSQSLVGRFINTTYSFFRKGIVSGIIKTTAREYERILYSAIIRAYSDYLDYKDQSIADKFNKILTKEDLEEIKNYLYENDEEIRNQIVILYFIAKDKKFDNSITEEDIMNVVTILFNKIEDDEFRKGVENFVEKNDEYDVQDEDETEKSLYEILDDKISSETYEDGFKYFTSILETISNIKDIDDNITITLKSLEPVINTIIDIYKPDIPNIVNDDAKKMVENLLNILNNIKSTINEKISNKSNNIDFDKLDKNLQSKLENKKISKDDKEIIDLSKNIKDLSKILYPKSWGVVEPALNESILFEEKVEDVTNKKIGDVVLTLPILGDIIGAKFNLKKDKDKKIDLTLKSVLGPYASKELSDKVGEMNVSDFQSKEMIDVWKNELISFTDDEGNSKKLKMRPYATNLALEMKYNIIKLHVAILRATGEQFDSIKSNRRNFILSDADRIRCLNLWKKKILEVKQKFNFYLDCDKLDPERLYESNKSDSKFSSELEKYKGSPMEKLENNIAKNAGDKHLETTGLKKPGSDPSLYKNNYFLVRFSIKDNDDIWGIFRSYTFDEKNIVRGFLLLDFIKESDFDVLRTNGNMTKNDVKNVIIEKCYSKNVGDGEFKKLINTSFNRFTLENDVISYIDVNNPNKYMLLTFRRGYDARNTKTAPIFFENSNVECANVNNNKIESVISIKNITDQLEYKSALKYKVDITMVESYAITDIELSNTLESKYLISKKSDNIKQYKDQFIYLNPEQK